MKNILVAAAILCSSAMSLAINVDLNAEGSYTNRKIITLKGIITEKECNKRYGVLRQGKCQVTQSQSNVDIVHFTDNSYMINISTKVRGQKQACSYSGLAEARNVVHLVSRDTDTCSIEARFENQNTLDVVTVGSGCTTTCNLNLDDVKRFTKVKSKK